MLNEILSCRDSNDLALVRDDQIEYLNQLGQLTLSLLRDLISKYGADQVHIVTNSLEVCLFHSVFDFQVKYRSSTCDVP